MIKDSTTKLVIDQYHSVTRRPTIEDPVARRVIFKSLKRVISYWLPTDKAAPILDIACGQGALLAYLRQEGYTNLLGFDLSPENVLICHRLGLTFVEEYDALEVYQYKTELEFSAVFLMDILEHIPKERAATFLSSVRERLAFGGQIVIQTPNMGSVVGLRVRYSDLSHEFGLTERSTLHLLYVAGFENSDVDIRPAWNATTLGGYLREIWLRLLHSLVYISEGASRPRIPTKNLLIRAIKK